MPPFFASSKKRTNNLYKQAANSEGKYINGTSSSSFLISSTSRPVGEMHMK